MEYCDTDFKPGFVGLKSNCLMLPQGHSAAKMHLNKPHWKSNMPIGAQMEVIGQENNRLCQP